MSTAESNSSAAPQWEASNLSLIAFPTEQLADFNNDWWTQLTGCDELESVKRKLERVDDGQYHNHGLKLQMNPLQIIWLSGPLNSSLANAPDGNPTLGSFDAARDDFLEVMDRWLRLPLPSIKRISFTGDLLIKFSTRAEAYAMLNRCLPSLDVDPASADFLYRINRKRQSQVGDWEINRLSTWMALEFRSVFAVVGAGVTQMGSNGFACAVQVDINTAGDRTQPLPTGLLPQIFRELANLASEIAVNGDIP